MYLNPIVGMLHNTKANRFHPILFCEDPLPGPPSQDKPCRHKSKMHHTSGFDTREAALVNAKELTERTRARECLAADFPWDGEDIPAMTVYFAEKGGQLEPVLM